MKRVVFFLALLVALSALSSAGAAPRIVNGQVADPADWPSQFAVVESDKRAMAGQFCGGTLIAPRWILTAAHCTYKYKNGQEQPIAPEEIDVVYGANLNIEEERLSVEEIVRHPSYTRYKPIEEAYIYAYDVALLKTSAPSLRPTVKIATPKQSKAWRAGKKARLAGWGTLYPVWAGPNLLHDVDLRIVSQKYCSLRAIWGGYYPKKKKICAQSSRGVAMGCFGDSGGSLMGTVNGETYALGTYSMAFLTCASKRYPGVWSRVAPISQWIKGYTESNSPDISKD